MAAIYKFRAHPFRHNTLTVNFYASYYWYVSLYQLKEIDSKFVWWWLQQFPERFSKKEHAERHASRWCERWGPYAILSKDYFGVANWGLQQEFVALTGFRPDTPIEILSDRIREMLYE